MPYGLKKKNSHDRRKLRQRIFNRDNRCHYCRRSLQIDQPMAEDYISIDHKIPVCQGGSNNDENIVGSCYNCNQKKGGRCHYEPLFKHTG